MTFSDALAIILAVEKSDHSDMELPIFLQYDQKQQCATAYDEEKQVGICQYDRRDGIWCIYHTYTDPSYTGQGIARQMVERVVKEAETSGVELIATCWYARKVLGL